MHDGQQQWVVINRNTGTIYGSRVYLSEKTALSKMRGLYIDKSDLMPVQLTREFLLSLGNLDAKESIK